MRRLARLRLLSIAVALLLPAGVVLAGHGGGSHGGGSHSSHSGSHSGSRSGSHSRSTSGHSGSRPGYGGAYHGPVGSHHGHGHGGHLHHSHHPRWGPHVPFSWGYWGYFGGCSWIWSDWSCWNPPDGFVLLPPEEVDDPGAESLIEVSGDEDPGEESDAEDDRDAPPARGTRSASVLVFDISPEDAVVYVDDEYEGTAADLNALERGLRVPPGEHVVTVLRPGFHDSTLTVETRSGKSTNVDVDLTR